MDLLTALTILLLVIAICQSIISDLRLAVHVLVAQSIIVALACFGFGLQTGETHIHIAAMLTVLVKCIGIPYALFRVLPLLQQEREKITSSTGLLLSFFSVVLAGGLIRYGLPQVPNTFTLVGAVSLMLIGLVLIVTRHQALLQIVGLTTMENGLYLVGLAITNGLPLIIDLGIFFDMLVAVIVLGLLTARIKVRLNSTDTSNLQELKG